MEKVFSSNQVFCKPVISVKLQENYLEFYKNGELIYDFPIDKFNAFLPQIKRKYWFSNNTLTVCQNLISENSKINLEDK